MFFGTISAPHVDLLRDTNTMAEVIAPPLPVNAYEPTNQTAPVNQISRYAHPSAKLPPNSEDAEQSVLGALLIDPRAWDKIVGTITEGDFYRKNHAVIFTAMQSLAKRNQPFDVITVTEELKSHGELDKAGGDLYLYELAKNTPTAANVKAYADIVREKSVLRKLIEVSTDITEEAYSTGAGAAQALLDVAESKIFKIAEQNSRGTGPVELATLLSKATNRLDELYHSDNAITGMETGFKDLDNLTSGMQKGDLVIIAGRPSMGKTAFAMNIAEHAAIKSGEPILVFSLEMPGEQLTLRMMSSLGRIDAHRVRTGQLTEADWPRVASAVGVLSDANMLIDDTPALTPNEVRSRARRVAREYGELGMIVIDYLQLMQVVGTKENRTNEISEISRSLKAIAKELNTPVLALSQLNRSLEQRTDRRPVMSDLRESGAIEQDADVILFVYRDEVYNEDSADKGTAEIIIGKQRNGPIGKVRLTFLGKYTRFENFSASKTIQVGS